MVFKVGGIVGKIGEQISSGAASHTSSLEASVDQIVDSGGDFFRAVGRGDLGGAGSDLLAIGAEATNIMTGGTMNVGFNAFRRFVTPDIPTPDFEDRKNQITSASAPRRMIYGETRTGGVVRYAESSGDNDKFIHLIVIFAAHSCDSVSEIYFDGDLAFIGTTAQGKFVGKASAIVETGKQTVANAAIVADTPSGWTNDHKLLGQTYAYFKLEYDTDVFRSIPNITATVKGKDDILDPRTGLNGWTDNQSLCAMDYLRSQYGFRTQLSEIDQDSFTVGANIADELVASGVGVTEKRYTVNGSISIIDDPRAPLDNMMIAGMSTIQYIQGAFRFIPGVYVAPTSQNSLGTSQYTFDSTTSFTFDSTIAPTFDSGYGINYKFTDDDLIGGIAYTPSGDTDSRVNATRGSYIDPGQDYEAVDFVQLNIPAYETQDKEILYSDTKFQFVNSGTTARRLSKIFLERSRYGVRLSVRFKLRALEFGVGDRIEFESVSEGLANKVYRIDEITPSIDGADVSLSEDDPLVWDWQEGDALVVTPPPPLSLPDPLTVSSPTGLTVSESVYIGNDQSSLKSRVTIDWDNNDVIQRWEAQGSFDSGPFVDLTSYVSTNSFILDDAQIGDWTFRVRAVNGIGAKSAYTSSAFTTNGKTTVPAAISGFAGTRRPNGVEINWNESADQDVAYYEVRNGASWAAGTPVRQLTGNGFLWEPENQTVSTLWVKAYDKSGGESATATSLIVGTGSTAVTSDTGPIVNNKVSFADNTSGYYLGDEEFIVGNASTFLSFSPTTQFDLVTPELTITGGSVDFSGTISTSDNRFKVQNTGNIPVGSENTVCSISAATGSGVIVSSTSTNPALISTSQDSTAIRAISGTGGNDGGVAVEVDSNAFNAISATSRDANGALLKGQISGAYAINTNIDPLEDLAGRAALIVETQQDHRPHIQMLTQHTVFPTASDGAIILGVRPGGETRIYIRTNGFWRSVDASGAVADGVAIP